MNLVGFVYLVTGGNSGIGLETVKQLAKQGGTVVFTSRDLKAGKQIEKDINAKLTLGNSVEAMQMDLSDIESVDAFTADFKRKYSSLHGLINNAGIMDIKTRELSKSKAELQFATNHLGHFHLTNRLLDVLKASKPSRVVCVSSCFHFEAFGKKGRIDYDDVNFDKRPYDGYLAYAQSKLANVLHARELARRVKGTGVSAVSIHPGWVRTRLARHTMPLWLQDWVLIPVFRLIGMIEPWQGAQTTLFCTLDPSIPENSGKFYSQTGIYGPKTLYGWPMESPNPEVNDENAAKLWSLSESMVEGACKKAT